jgi:hypothetical protein
MWKIIVLGLSLLALGACACRPGVVGPYGGVHPPRCVVY